MSQENFTKNRGKKRLPRKQKKIGLWPRRKPNKMRRRPRNVPKKQWRKLKQKGLSKSKTSRSKRHALNKKMLHAFWNKVHNLIRKRSTHVQPPLTKPLLRWTHKIHSSALNLAGQNTKRVALAQAWPR